MAQWRANLTQKVPLEHITASRPHASAEGIKAEFVTMLAEAALAERLSHRPCSNLARASATSSVGRSKRHNC